MQQASPPPPSPYSLAERRALIAAILGQLPPSLVARRTGRTPQALALDVLANALEAPGYLSGYGGGSHTGTTPAADRRQTLTESRHPEMHDVTT